MSFRNSIHNFLQTSDWNTANIEKFLERDSSSINARDSYNRTPLLIVLRDNRCSAELVKLLIRFGANVNSNNNVGDTLLHTAIRYYRNDEAIFKVLLEAGINVNARVGDPIICYALRWNISKNIIQMLLDAGVPADDCTYHGSVMHCAVKFKTEDIINLLIEKGASLNRLDRLLQSPMCIALRWCRQVIEILLRAGGSFGACERHTSPFFCALDTSTNSIVTASEIKYLLNLGASQNGVDVFGNTPLQFILSRRKYETEAIQLLFNFRKIDVNTICHLNFNTLLHYCVMNEHYQLSAVKFLLKRGAQVDRRNAFNQTVLHVAANNRNCQPSLMNILVKHCSNVNVMDHTGQTLLRVAAGKLGNSAILKPILAAGARVRLKDGQLDPLLKKVLEDYPGTQGEPDYTVLLKYYILEIPNFNIHDYIVYHSNIVVLLSFVDDCERELRDMESTYIGQDLSLREFLSRHSENPMNAKFDPENYEVFSQLLKLDLEHSFPIYFDVIWNKVYRSSMKTELEELLLYTIAHCPDSTCIQKKITLDCYSAFGIAAYLSKDEFLSLILGFYNAVNHARVSCSKNMNLLGKRSRQQSAKFPKLPRLKP